VLKVVGAMKDQEVFTPNERTVEALDTLAEIGLQNRETKYAAQNVKESLAASKRASEGMGVRSVNHLRAVLREYLAVRKQPKGQSTVARLKRGIVGANIPGYFPTPPSAAARVVELAKIEPGQLVLEPSAGSGALADAAKAAGGEVRVVERNLSLREILQAKGHPLVGNDTMDVRGAYDRILMNPPFEDSQDIEHVLHAYENQLAPGGRLVAIVSRGALTRSDKKAQGFRDWIASVGAETENLPDGTFASKESERKTGVATSIVIADKPKPGSAQK
jgi:protein-L-isoaspartate O-methyltransferase